MKNRIKLIKRHLKEAKRLIRELDLSKQQTQVLTYDEIVGKLSEKYGEPESSIKENGRLSSFNLSESDGNLYDVKSKLAAMFSLMEHEYSENKTGGVVVSYNIRSLKLGDHTISLTLNNTDQVSYIKVWENANRASRK